MDLSKARYVRLDEAEGHFVLVLLDEDKQEIGHGYKGPTPRRAQDDLKYWTRTKGLEEVTPSNS
jgi:hypothetical protein